MPSSVIRSFSYSAKNSELSITFVSGRRYVYTDLCDGTIMSLVPHRRRARGVRTTGLHVTDPSSFGEAHHSLYVASLDGPVYRLVPKH